MPAAEHGCGCVAFLLPFRVVVAADVMRQPEEQRAIKLPASEKGGRLDKRRCVCDFVHRASAIVTDFVQAKTIQ